MKTRSRWSRFMLVGVMIAASAFAIISTVGTSQAPATPGQGITLNAGIATWTSAEPVSAVYQTLLQQLGYTVNVKSFASNGLAYTSIANGDLDYWPNGWFPLHNPQLPEGFASKAHIFQPDIAGGALQGYLVDIPSIKKYHITSLQDFKDNPTLDKAFDDNGDGKADLFGCPPGWGCYDTINFHLKAYGLDQYINHDTAAYPANFAAAKSRIANGLPTLYYTWTPNSTILQLVPGKDVQWINLVDDASQIQEAPSQQGFAPSTMIASLGDQAVTDPVIMGFVAANIDVVANNQFLMKNPAAWKLFEQIQLPLAWVSDATNQIDSNNADPMALAQQWISDNQNTVDGWMSAARDAAVH